MAKTEGQLSDDGIVNYEPHYIIQQNLLLDSGDRCGCSLTKGKPLIISGQVCGRSCWWSPKLTHGLIVSNDGGKRFSLAEAI